jgi:hypothetical protein
MRPESILMFERLFLASLVVSAGSFVIGYDAAMRAVETDPAMQQFGLGGSFMIGALAVSFAIYLLLWYLIAHRASNVARWILVVLVALGVASLPLALTGPMSFTVLLNLAVYALEVAALVFLFRADAKAWFRGERPSDPATFD